MNSDPLWLLPLVVAFGFLMIRWRNQLYAYLAKRDFESYREETTKAYKDSL